MRLAADNAPQMGHGTARWRVACQGVARVVLPAVRCRPRGEINVEISIRGDALGRAEGRGLPMSDCGLMTDGLMSKLVGYRSKSVGYRSKMVDYRSKLVLYPSKGVGFSAQHDGLSAKLDVFCSIADGFWAKTCAFGSIAVLNRQKSVGFASIPDDFPSIPVGNPTKTVVNPAQTDAFRAKTVVNRPIEDARATINDGNRA